MNNKGMHMFAYVFLFVGGLNWGLVGLLQLNVVNLVLGSAPWLERLVYVLVGVATVHALATHKNDCKVCGKK